MTEEDKNQLNTQTEGKKTDNSITTENNENVDKVKKSLENDEKVSEESVEQATNTENIIQETKSEILKEEPQSENSNISTLTDENFKSEVLESKIPYLVKFTATWCSPCKTIDPFLSEISSEMSGKLKIGKLDISDHPNTPTAYGVRGVPTMMLVKDSNVLSQRVGATRKLHIVSWINETLSSTDTKKDISSSS